MESAAYFSVTLGESFKKTLDEFKNAKVLDEEKENKLQEAFFQTLRSEFERLQEMKVSCNISGKDIGTKKIRGQYDITMEDVNIKFSNGAWFSSPSMNVYALDEVKKKG